jgi:NAD(P)-dependent dehydrogenase (short-subunit alcohol dehydrogenase family)
MNPMTAVLEGVDDDVTASCAQALELAGFRLQFDGPHDDVSALVVNPGLYRPQPNLTIDRPAADLLNLVAAHGLSESRNPASVVVINARDSLGSAIRPRVAAASGALVSTARSLALALAPRRVTVNMVMVNHSEQGEQNSASAAEPHALLHHKVTTDDVGRAVAFFADPRSRYVTGQIFYVDGGSSLLSNHSM